MKSLLILLALSSVVSAGKLPTYGRHPWFKTYHGYEARDMDVALATDGSVVIYPKEDNKRISDSYVVTTKIQVEYRSVNSQKWVRRTISQSGFEVTKAPSLQQPEVSIIGSVTGGVKFKLKLKHDRKGVSIFASFAQQPDTSKASYRLSLISEVEDLYGITNATKRSSVSEKIRGDGLTIRPHKNDDVRKKKFKLNKDFTLQEFEEMGVYSIVLKANRYGRNDFTWSVAEEGKGALDLTLKNPAVGAHKGFYVVAVLVNQHGELQSKGMRIEFH